MKKEIMEKAFDSVDESYIEEFFQTKEQKLAAKKRKIKRRRFLPWAAGFVCFAVICAAVVMPILSKKKIDGVIESGNNSNDSATHATAAPDSSNNVISVDSFESSDFESPIVMLGDDCKTSNAVNGIAVKYGGGSVASSTHQSPPSFGFTMEYVAVVAKAVEELGAVYESLNSYGSIYIYEYRVYKMEVVDSLESGLEGEFYYALPSYLKGDLTEYDSLLMAMSQLPKGHILKNIETNSLQAFDKLFTAPAPEMGNITAFTEGVFDESLWQDPSWLYGYQFAKQALDGVWENEAMFVKRGTSLEEALASFKAYKEEYFSSGWYTAPKYEPYDYKTEDARAQAEYMKPFENGVFNPVSFGTDDVYYFRYIGGIPTNQWVCINTRTESVLESEYAFEDEDFSNLPDLAAYVAALKLEDIQPKHMDVEGKKEIYNYVTAWYEKTDSGVYSFVKVSWHYASQDYRYDYYDERFYIISEDGAEEISREALVAIVGDDNSNVSKYNYGAPYERPNE